MNETKLMEEEMTVKHFCSVAHVISGEFSINMYLGYFQVCYLCICPCFHFLGQDDEADKRENNCSGINCLIYCYIKKSFFFSLCKQDCSCIKAFENESRDWGMKVSGQLYVWLPSLPPR